jgi:hypothetical protein
LRNVKTLEKIRRNPISTAAILWPAAVFFSLFCLSLQAHAIDDTKRTKVIDFEDEVVEGVNKKPLDSVDQISEANRKKHKPHLYRKRGGFRTETAETLRALRFTP